MDIFNVPNSLSFLDAQLPLLCPHYSCISKRAKTVNVAFKTKTRGTIQHLAVDTHIYEIIAAELSLSNVSDGEVLGGRLSLRSYKAQVGETYAMMKALNKLTGLGMPETIAIF